MLFKSKVLDFETLCHVHVYRICLVSARSDLNTYRNGTVTSVCRSGVQGSLTEAYFIIIDPYFNV